MPLTSTVMAQLSAGTRLGPYEIAGPIGAGGMGQVYRARDTRLNRDVAVKCLGPELSGDASSRRRIEREARATASLSHPHICTLFDIGEHDGEAFLVMELLDGETLAGRLLRAKTGLPRREAMTVAAQVADALTVAHRHGLVHRDIKPGNIMLTRSGAKLLDFGLARSADDAGADTRSLITRAHERIGTPAYMAPEQLAGAADHRSDIYALGAVMFEMLTGARATTGDGTPFGAGTPPALERLVRKCLEKDPDRRWQSAADLADELRWIAASPSAASGGARMPGTWVIAGAALLTVVAAGLIAVPRFRDRPSEPYSQLSFLLPPNVALQPFGAGVALSPDASMVAFSAVTGSGAEQQLFVKRLDALEARPIAGTARALYPFFAPDSQSVGFFTRGTLWRWSVASDSVTKIADLTADPDDGSPATWSLDGTILFGQTGDRPKEGLRRLRAAGGVPEVLTRPDNSQGEHSHFAPEPLPSGHLMYTVRSVGPKGVGFKVVRRDRSGAVATLIPGASLATYLGANEMLYQAGSTLMLADFDPSALTVTRPRKVIDGVYMTTNSANWAVARDTIVYRPVETPRRRLVWVDRSGRIMPIETELRNFAHPSISPSGDRVAVSIHGQGATSDTWILDLPRRTLAPLTSDTLTSFGVWSADGREIIASRLNGAARDVVALSPDGSAPDRLLLQNGEQSFGAALARDGRTLVVMTPGRTTGPDIAIMDRDDPQSLRFIAQTPATEYGGRVSPDGKWLSYFSDRSGRMELYVTPFPQGGPKWQLSRNGAREAVWSRDGRELFFRQGDALYAISVHDTAPFSWDAPRELFRGTFSQQGGPGSVHYDVAADGRFLMIEEVPARSASFNVLRGWRQLVQ
jgi:hypothetical protein